MLVKKVKSRILFLILLFISFSIVIFVILKSLEENVVYFLSPTEIFNKTDISLNKTIRIGGLVKINSIDKQNRIIWVSTRLLITLQTAIPNIIIRNNIESCSMNIFGYPLFNEGKEPRTPVIILSVGRLVEKKGFDILLRALASLPQSLHWYFEHAGSGPLARELRHLAAMVPVG